MQKKSAKIVIIIFMLLQSPRLVCYNQCMKIDLAALKGKKVCVACSGGRDSVALLHYLSSHGAEWDIAVCAVNCDHGMRPSTSARDSAFVAEFCKRLGVPLAFFRADGFKSEGEAREWRYSCFAEAAERFSAAIATAHHVGDNAETLLFNLARGCALSGACGIARSSVRRGAGLDGRGIVFEIFRPLSDCTRADIDAYVSENALRYVDDETNFSGDYTRNYIRLNVLPELSKVVPGAAENMRRFCDIAAEDERFLCSLAADKCAIYPDVCYIYDCAAMPVFGRAAMRVVRDAFGKRDYCRGHIESLYAMQREKPGKRYRFLGLTAWREEGRIAVERDFAPPEPMPFGLFDGTYCGGKLRISCSAPHDAPGALRLDADKLPPGCVIRPRADGDRFTKFGGGTKSLGDYLTDKKIPARLRARLPVIARGNTIFAVCGVEISELVRVDEGSSRIVYICCAFD